MIMRRVPQAVLVLAALAAAPAVQAQASNDWAWRATLYGWLPGVQATTRYDFGG